MNIIEWLNNYFNSIAATSVLVAKLLIRACLIGGVLAQGRFSILPFHMGSYGNII